MTGFGKITSAFALSVLAHVALFTVLALWPAPVVSAAINIREEPPLEVTLQAAPAAEALPKPTPEPQQSAPAQAELSLPAAQGLRTQLDPERLKVAETAPENPVAIAAHNSRATPNQLPPPDAAKPQPSPAPTPDPGALTLEAASPPAPAASVEIGIDALGSYGKAVGNAIGSRWEAFRKSEKESLAVGEVQMKFALDAQGRVSDVEVLSNTGNARNAACAERAVNEAQIPPIPPERLAQVPGGRIRIVYSFTIY